jgi:hypothetical protein
MEAYMKKASLALTLLFVLFAVQASAQESDTSGKLFWRGNVDDKLHLVIRGTSLEHRTVSGQSQTDGAFSFTAPLPQQTVTVSVPRFEGRSKKITVVQQPTAENQFTAIIEIIDDGAGARDYFLEIAWR